MNSSPSREDLPPAPDAPDAAAWVARLHSPARRALTDGALRHWLDEDADHRQAFHHAAGVWEDVAVAGRMYETRRIRRRSAALAAMVAVAASALTLAVWQTDEPPATYRTGVGEQHVTVLEDGSQVTLNTNSRLSVRYTGGAREVTLHEGEAFFEIAHDPDHPFIVHVDEREVRALGTSFVVFKAGGDVAVTLLEGKVSVGLHREGTGPAGADPGLVVLEPGQRWRLGSASVAQLTPLELESTVQWRRQEVVFNDTPLAAAVAEMNRYTADPLVLSGTEAAGRRVSGIFRIADTDSFIRTVDALYGVTLVRQSAVAQP